MRTPKKLVRNLIIDYQKGIKEVEKWKSVKKINSIIREHKLYAGICRLIYFKYPSSYYNRDWIKKGFSPNNSYYWCKIPDLCSSKEEKLKALKYRLRTLKRLLKEA